MNLKIGIGAQADEKTKATTITQLRATESNLKPTFNKVDSEDFNGSAYKGDSVVVTESASGNITCHLTPETLKLLFDGFGYKLATGNAGITDPKLTVTDFARATETGKVEKYFTIVEQNLEDGEERVLIGCQINNITFNISQGAYITVNLEVIGYEHKYEDGSLTTIKPLKDYDKRLTCIDATLKLATSDVSANTQSIEITLNNNLEAKYGLGSRAATRIVRNGKIEANANLTFNAYDKAIYKKAYENLLSGDTAEAVINMQTKDKKYIGIYLHKLGTSNVEFTDKNASGGLTQELNIQYDPTNKTPITFALGTVN